MLEAAVSRYLEKLAEPKHPVLRAMEKEALRLRFPIIGPQVGRLLFALVRMAKIRTVWEGGSGFGYSALWFALALPKNGRVTLTERNPEWIKKGRAYLQKAGMLSKIRYLEGDALALLEKDKHCYDFYFCDMDKERYPDFYALVRQRVRPGDIVTADNTLWGGNVARENKDKRSAAIDRFNRAFQQDSRFTSFLAPIRDGVSVHVRLKRTRPF